MSIKDLKLKSLPTWPVLGLMAVAVFASLAWMSEAPVRTRTVRNLQAVYSAKVNTYVRYLAYAERAQEEEYGEVASLFRAAACAEHVQQRNLVTVMRKMGFEPGRRIDSPVVKTTAENLRRAADDIGASERDTMYLQFIKEAKAEGNEDAVRTFQYAMGSESQHSKLFKAALTNLHRMSAEESHLYYVCNVCGYTTKHAVKPCPICGKVEYEEMF